MSNINTHLGQDFNWIASKNAHNTFTISFTEDGEAYDISALTFTMVIRKRNSSSALLTLTQGAGLTNGGATGILTIVLTQAQASTTLTGSDYFWELKYTSGDFTYNAFQGGLQLVKDNNPESTATALSATVSLEGTNVSASLTVLSSFGSSNIDGGSFSDVYSDDQNLDGGSL